MATICFSDAVHANHRDAAGRDDAEPIHLHEAQGVHSHTVPRGQSVRVQVLLGMVWLTQEGRPGDRVLQANEKLVLAGPVRLHIGALGEAGCRVTLTALTTPAT